MMRGEMKLRARSLILTNPPRPHPCLVTLALLAFIWIVNYLAQKIGGQPILIDLNAVQKLDYQNMIRIDFANAEFVPTAILILFQLVDIVLSYGYIAYQLRVVRGEASGFGNLLDGFAITGRAIALTLLIDALVMVASAALLVPGLILSYAYAMASYLQVDHPDWSPVRCMRESRLMMRGHKWELFVLQLSFLGWQILATIPGVSIFVKPYVAFTETVFYENLRAPAAEQPPQEFGKNNAENRLVTASRFSRKRENGYEKDRCHHRRFERHGPPLCGNGAGIRNV